MKKSLFTAFAVGLGLTASVMAQMPSYVPTNGLVGWWPFNGNANDESGNGNNGYNTGAINANLSVDRFGIINSSYYITSNSGITTSYSGVLGGDSRSVNFWLKTANTGYIVPLSWGSTNTQGGRFSCGFNFNNPGVTIDIANSAITYSSNQPVNDNNWHMYTWIFDSSQGNTINFVKIYQDGLLLTNIAANFNNNVLIYTINDYNLRFGGFDNYLDDVGIWNRALTQQEIIDLYNANNCTNDLTISPTLNTQNIGGNATFTTISSDANPTYIWQSDFGQGFQTLNNYGNYSGATTNTLTVNNVQLSNHNQPFRVIASNGNCGDTSNIATIQIADTCITNVTVYDTILTTVTDTLIINTTLSLPAPNNENTILIYPNPASDHITIDNGNFAAMAGYSIKIENNAGQQVFQSAINQAQFYVDLSTWSGNGLYFVHLIDPQNNTVTVRKIVLQ